KISRYQEQFVNRSARGCVDGWACWPVQNRAEVGGGFMDFARSRVAIGVAALASFWLLGWPDGPTVPMSSAQEAKSGPPIWTVPEIGALPNDADGRLVRGGRDLITATYAHIGPQVPGPTN